MATEKQFKVDLGIETPAITSPGNLTLSPSNGGITVSGNTNITGTLDASGNFILGGEASFSGNLTVLKDLQVNGNINFTGTVTQISGNSGQFFGDANGIGALYAGIPVGFASVYNPVIQASASSNDYVQVNFQNINNGTQNSVDYVLTTDDGSDTQGYMDMGMTGSSWDGTQLNSLGNAAGGRDGYLYVQGGLGGGNLVIGTTTAGTQVKFIVGGPESSNIVANISNNGIDAKAVYTDNYYYANGSPLPTVSGSSSVTTTGNVTAGNISTTGNVVAGSLKGDGGNISNIRGANVNGAVSFATTANSVAGANVSGAVGLATYATIANTVAVANVSGIGNVATINRDGNSSNILYGNGVFAAAPTSGGLPIANGNSNVNIATANGNVTIAAVGNNVVTVTGTGANITGTANITGNVTLANLAFSSNAGQIVFNTTAYISGNANALNRDGSIILSPYTGSGSNFAGVVIGGAGRLLSPGGSVHQIFNASDVTFQVAVKTPAIGSTSTTTGGLQVGGGAGVVGNLYVGGLTNITGNLIGGNANFSGAVNANGNVTTSGTFVGNGAGLTNVTINQAGNIIGTSPNVSLVAGSYTYTFDNAGTLTLPAGSGAGGADEGGQINFNIGANSTLSGPIALDQYVNRMRIFETGGTNRGVYVDLSQAGTGVSTLLNNRVSGFVNAGTYVTMDNLKATVSTSGNRSLQIATVSGSYSVFVNAVYTLFTGSTAGTGASLTLTTTPVLAINWNFSAQGDTVIYTIVDTTNSRSYRVTMMIGGGYNNNMISIERLI